jgi:hypothetical protein
MCRTVQNPGKPVRSGTLGRTNDLLGRRTRAGTYAQSGWVKSRHARAAPTLNGVPVDGALLVDAHHIRRATISAAAADPAERKRLRQAERGAARDGSSSSSTLSRKLRLSLTS